VLLIPCLQLADVLPRRIRALVRLVSCREAIPARAQPCRALRSAPPELPRLLAASAIDLQSLLHSPRPSIVPARSIALPLPDCARAVHDTSTLHHGGQQVQAANAHSHQFLPHRGHLDPSAARLAAREPSPAHARQGPSVVAPHAAVRRVSPQKRFGKRQRRRRRGRRAAPAPVQRRCKRHAVANKPSEAAVVGAEVSGAPVASVIGQLEFGKAGLASDHPQPDTHAVEAEEQQLVRQEEDDRDGARRDREYETCDKQPHRLAACSAHQEEGPASARPA
jgi:hypothetical protein